MDSLLRIKKEHPKALFTSECIRFILIIIIFTLSGISIHSIKFSKFMFQDLMKNWQKFPIEDIILSRNGVCDNGYSPLINNEYWPGTKQGCMCLNGLLEDDCPTKRFSCYPVWRRNPIHLTYWRRSLLCAKPYPLNYLYFSLNIPRRKGECAFGFRNCGELDTLGNDLCIEEKYKCPITNIKIVDAANLNQTLSLRNYKVLKLNDGTYFLIGNGINETNNERESVDITLNTKVIIDLKFSEGQVCLNPYEKNTDFVQYKLINDFNSYTCRAEVDNLLYDDRYDKIDSYKWANIYQDNNLIQVISELPFYPLETLNAYVGLFTRDYIGIKYNCLNHDIFSPYMLTQNSILISEIFETQIIMFWFMISILASLLLNMYLEFNQNPNISIKFRFAFDLILLIIIIGYFITLIYYFFAIDSINYIFVNFKSMNCGDHMTNKIFSNFGERIFSAKNMTIFIIIITFLCVLVQPITYLILYFKFYKSIRNEESMKMNDNPTEMPLLAIPHD